MPTLNRYARSNSKTGYYVRANVGGSHPVTLQTTPVAERILVDNDYGDGHTIPTKLVWSMYDVDLLYTGSSLSASTPSYSVHDSLSKVMDSSALSNSTRERLIEYLSSYSGSHQKAVGRLLEDLRATVSVDAVQKYEPSRQTQNASEFLSEFSLDGADVESLLDEYGAELEQSLQSFSMRAPQLEGIEITGYPAIGYHFTSLTMPGDVVVYDRSISDSQGSTGQYDYRIKYREGVTSSVYVLDGEVRKVNGPTENISQAEAERLADELIPTKIPIAEVDVCVNSPPLSEVDLPRYAFIPKNTDLLVGVVDRISNSDNPVVETGDQHLLLDGGDEEKLYLINRVESQWGRVLCELPLPDAQHNPNDATQSSSATNNSTP